MSEAENVAAQAATANNAVDLDQQVHERRDIELLYKIYMDKRLESQANFYESRVRENEANADFTFILSAAVMALSAFVATVSAFGNSPIFSLLSAILPAFAALLAAFRQLYGWERQSSIYRDALLGLERVKLIAPDQDRMPLVDLPAIYPKLVNSSETVFTGEVNQWGQFVQNTEKTKEDTRESNELISNLQLTDAQIDTIRKIVAAGTPSTSFNQHTITVHPEETSALPSGNGGGTTYPASAPVTMTTTLTESTVIEHSIPPAEAYEHIDDAVPVADAEFPVTEDAVPTVDAEFPMTDDAVPTADAEFPVTEDAVPEGDIQMPVAEQPAHEWEEEQPPPPEALSSLAPGALHVDAPQEPPEGTFTEEPDPNANG